MSTSFIRRFQSTSAKRTRRLRLEHLEPRLALAQAIALVGDNGLIGFNTATPGITSSVFPYGGLVPGDSLVAIDSRPANSQLYALSSGSRLYRLQTGFATQIGSDGAFTLNGSAFGFDFDPTTDRIRVTSDADQNLRLNPNDGTLAGSDVPLAYKPGDVNEGQDPTVVDIAYTNNVAGTASTMLYGIDTGLDTLVLQDPPNSGLLTTVGPLGIDVVNTGGFEILTDLDGTTSAFAALSTDGVSSALYSIDLATGAATLIGNIGASATLVRGLAITPPRPAITILKQTNGTENNIAPGLFVPIGSSVTFTYQLGNNGTVPLSGVTVGDDNATPDNPADDFNATFFGGDANGNGLLDSAETWTFIASSVATEGQHRNIAIASATPPTGPRQQASNFDIYTGAQPTADLIVSKSNSSGAAVPGTTVQYRVEARNNGPFNLGATEQQLVAITGTAGTFTLTFNGQTTQPLAFNATITQVHNALIALSTIGGIGGDVVVIQEGSVYTIIFRQGIGAQNLPQIVATGSGGTSAAVTTLQDGAPGLHVQDLAPSQLTNVAHTALIPGNMNFPGGYSSGPGNLDQIVSLPANQAFAWIVTGTLSPAATGTLSNTATAAIVADVAEVNPANNLSTITVPITPQADLKVLKTDSPDPVVAGTNLTYTISVTNDGPSDAQGINLSDAIPSNTTFVSAQQVSGTTFMLTTPAVGGAGTFTASVATIPAGGIATFSLIVKVSPAAVDGSSITNTATATSTTTDITPGNNSDSESTAVVARADVSVIKTGSPDPVNAGENLTYTLIVNNLGPSDAQTVMLSDKVPTGTTFISAVQTNGPTFMLSKPSIRGIGTFSASAASLAAGETATFTMVVRVTPFVPSGAMARIGNKAEVMTATIDDNTANNSDTVSTIITTLADLSILKTGSPARAAAGETITYTLVVTNLGPSEAQGVNLSDVIPVSTTFVSVTQISGPAFMLSSPPPGDSGTFTATADTLAPSASATFRLIVSVDSALPTATTISNTASVTTTTNESIIANNSATADTEVSRGLPECNITTLNSPGASGTAVIRSDLDNPGDNVLLVTGTSKNDQLVIEPRPANMTQVRVKNTGRLLGAFSNNSFQHIVVYGLAGNDTIVIDPRITRPTIIFGGDGNDSLTGGSGNDQIAGGNGNDSLFGNNGNDTLCGDAGNDNLYGGNGNDLEFGQSGNDHLYGDAGKDQLLGGDGNDFLSGGIDNDQLFGQAGNDQLDGDASNDVIMGGAGNDKLYGSAGRDILIGGIGADQLYGQTADDILIGDSTTDDESPDMLVAILMKWTANLAYNFRVTTLRPSLNSNTVLDDGAADTLFGDIGQDWYFLGSRDKIRDRALGELIS